MAIQISTNDIDKDGFFTTTFTGDDTGQRLKGRIRCPRQGRPVVDYFYVSVTDPGAATTTTDFIRDRDGVGGLPERRCLPQVLSPDDVGNQRVLGQLRRFHLWCRCRQIIAEADTGRLRVEAVVWASSRACQ